MCIRPSTINESYQPGSVQVNEAIIGNPMQRIVSKITKVALLILAPVAALVFLPHPIGYFALIISAISLFNEFCYAQNGSQDNTGSRIEEEARRVQDTIRSALSFPESYTDPFIDTHRMKRSSAPLSTIGVAPVLRSNPYAHVPVGAGIVNITEGARIPTSISDPQISSLASRVPVGRGQNEQRAQVRADRARNEQPDPMRNAGIPNISQTSSTGMHVSVGSRPLAAAQPITQLPQTQLPIRSSTIFTPPVAARDVREHVSVGSRVSSQSDSID